MTTSSAIRVGFIGLGGQGGPMARRIIEAGYPVTLWARRPGRPRAVGDEETVEFCRPVFASHGDPIAHLGPVGAGQVTKLLNNAALRANAAGGMAGR